MKLTAFFKSVSALAVKLAQALEGNKIQKYNSMQQQAWYNLKFLPLKLPVMN